MRVVFDSSAFAKRYINEKGSETIDDLCQRTDVLALSVICPPEIFSAVNRRRREGSISDADYDLIKRRFVTELQDIVLLDLTTDVLSQAISLLEANALRSMDALHVACAFEWRPDLFVTSDQRQFTAAQSAGLPTQLV